MARISDDLKASLDEGRLAYAATCGDDSRPHVVPKGTFDEIAARVTHGQMTYHRAKHAVKISVEEVIELKY